MRPRRLRISFQALILAGLSAALPGCSTGGSITTANLAPVRGQYGADGYGTRQYSDPGTPTPRQYSSAYDQPGYGYGNVQTGSLPQGRGPYANAYGSDPNWRWSQGNASPSRWQQQAPVTTGSLGPRANVVTVREGDTLFGIARRYNVPVGEIAAANRLHSERIEIGQQLVIPHRYYR
jgi:LysM repeat protein